MISKGNRGYIFLISAAKTILLVFTLAFALSYIGSTFANLVLAWSSSHLTYAAEWGVYMACLVAFFCVFIVTFFITSRDDVWKRLRIVGLIFIAVALLSWLVVLVTICFVITAHHNSSSHQINDSFFGRQLCKNGNLSYCGNASMLQ